MTSAPDWLPPLVRFSDCGSDWERYERALYKQFERDFVKSHPLLDGVKVSFRREPMDQGKVATFWHLISEGKIEGDRLPDLERCERIGWPKAIIEHAHTDVVKVWENKRGVSTHVCLWLEDLDYIVILRKGRGYYVLLTAYQTTWSRTKRKLQKEYEASVKG